MNIGEWNSVFAVPSSVVDKYIKIAGGNALKLLLYMLRHGGETISEDKLKRDLGFCGYGELEDAALFWVQRGILKYDNTGSKMLMQPSADAKGDKYEPAPTDQKVSETPHAREKTAPAMVSSGEIADRIKTDKDLRLLYSEAEKLYGHALNQRETALVISLKDHYGLNVGVALMLLNYCFKIKKTSPSYINSVAANWSAEEINTIEGANGKILSLERQNDICEQLRSALEMDTKLTPAMKEYIRVWTEDWGFNVDMVMFAYNKTIDVIGKWRPSYTNKILENLHNQGINTVEAAKAADEQRRQQMTGKSGKSVKAVSSEDNGNSSFNIDDIMSSIIDSYNKRD